MKRPSNYSTKQGAAILAFLADAQGKYLTAAQITGHFSAGKTVISRPTVYRQLEKLVKEGRVRKFLFDGASVTSYRYVEDGKAGTGVYNLKCEVCDEMITLECEEIGNVSRHILTEHAFMVNGGKTVFYGKCKSCRQ